MNGETAAVLPMAPPRAPARAPAIVKAAAPHRSNGHAAGSVADAIREAQEVGRRAGLLQAASHVDSIKVEASQRELTVIENLNLLLEVVAGELRVLARGEHVPLQRAHRKEKR
jgi:hypothetical protein